MSLRFVFPALMLASTLVGCAPNLCALHDRAPHGPRPGSHAAEASAAMLPIVERTPLVGDVDADALTAAHDERTSPPAGYRALSAEECQCLACDASVIGSLLDRERWTSCLHDLKASERRARCLQLSVLRAAANEARNKNAADALKLYYGIAEAEAGLDVVVASLAVVDDMDVKLAQLRREQITIPFDASAWARQRFSLESKRADLDATLLKLNAQLRALLGLEAETNAVRLFPTEKLRVTNLTLDVEAEVAYGLDMKPELEVARILSTADPETTTAAIRGLLGGMHGLMGMTARTVVSEWTRSALGVRDGEGCVRRNQMAQWYTRRRSSLAGEIAAATATIELRRTQAIAAARTAASWHRRIEELEQKRHVDGATFVEIAEAKMHRLAARGELTSAAIHWKRALVDLRELQGALVAECRGNLIPASSGILAVPSPSKPSPVQTETLPDVDSPKLRPANPAIPERPMSRRPSKYVELDIEPVSFDDEIGLPPEPPSRADLEQIPTIEAEPDSSYFEESPSVAIPVAPASPRRSPLFSPPPPVSPFSGP